MESPPSSRSPMGSWYDVTEPHQGILLALSLALTAYVVAFPFTQATYPPITDLPFHAAQTSILRHYLDPEFHFREQFSLHPLEVPYLSMYALGAAFAWVMPITAATKLAAICMLLLVPTGLAVLCVGMGKHPMWGLTGLGLTWGTVSQWGFYNFMGALGLFAMSIGVALLVVRRPTLTRRVGLALCLVGIFFTHVFRLPFALLGVLVAGALVYPVTRRFRPLLGPMVPAVLLFVVWIVVRPRGLGVSGTQLGFDPGRLAEIPRHLFGAYLPMDGAPATPEGDEERAIARRMLASALFCITAVTALYVTQGRTRFPSRMTRKWVLATTALPLLFALGLLVGYLVLPYEAGRWFFVYPREITAATLFALAAAPDVPRRTVERVALVVLIGLGVTPMTRFVAARFREFEAATRDFRLVMAEMPRAPRLFYLMYWLGDSAKRVPPFLHLPAWVQAEKGGALGFHFVQWSHSPIRYRSDGGDAVPPPLPDRFEWTPQYFKVEQHGRWFDTFLVRHRQDPHELFDPDPSIRLVSRHGTWWLYRRER